MNDTNTVKVLWFFLLAMCSALLCAGTEQLPSVLITRHLGSGGTQTLALRCEEDATVVERASCWLTISRAGSETEKKNLRLKDFSSILDAFFQRAQASKVSRTLATSRVAFRWEISDGQRHNHGAIAYGDGSENDAADAALSVEFLLSSKFLE